MDVLIMNILEHACIDYNYVIDISTSVTKYLSIYRLPLDIIKHIIKLMFTNCDYSSNTIEIKPEKVVLSNDQIPRFTSTKCVLSYNIELKSNQTLNTIYIKGKTLYHSASVFSGKTFLGNCVEFQQRLLNLHENERVYDLYLQMTGQRDHFAKDNIVYAKLKIKDSDEQKKGLFSKYKTFTIYVNYDNEIDDINYYNLYPQITEITYY